MYYQYLHPAPPEAATVDHRDTHNRHQLRYPSEEQAIWIRTVEDVAKQLCIEPAVAHNLLLDGAYHMTKGLIWEKWW